MTYRIMGVAVLAAAVAATAGCGKKASETMVEKMTERAMAKEGIKGKVNISDGKVTMETKDGKVSYAAGEGTTVPPTFPKDVLVYGGAKVTASMATPEGHHLVLETADGAEKVLAAYKDKMAGEGWTEAMTMNQEGTAMRTYKKESRTASIIVMRSGNATQVTLTVANQ